MSDKDIEEYHNLGKEYERKKMIHKNQYIYPKTVREAIEGKRHYVIKTEKLPSVTTILSATESAEKREALARWREVERRGDCDADRG